MVYYIYEPGSKKEKRNIGESIQLPDHMRAASGTYYIAETNNMIAAITGGTTRVDKMAVAILEDDYAQTIEDAADYNFGIQFRQGGDNIQTAVTNLQEELGSDLTVTDCGSVQDQAAELFAGNVDAIIYNEAYTELMDDAVEGFSDNTRIIYEMDIRTEIKLGGGNDASLTKMCLPCISAGSIHTVKCPRQAGVM